MMAATRRDEECDDSNIPEVGVFLAGVDMIVGCHVSEVDVIR